MHRMKCFCRELVIIRGHFFIDAENTQLNFTNVFGIENFHFIKTRIKAKNFNANDSYSGWQISKTLLFEVTGNQTQIKNNEILSLER